jgi:hypothetical protein
MSTTDARTITKNKLEKALSNSYDRGQDDGYDKGHDDGSATECARCRAQLHAQLDDVFCPQCRSKHECAQCGGQLHVELDDVFCEPCRSAHASDLVADLLACAHCGNWLTPGRVVLGRSGNGWALWHETCASDNRPGGTIARGFDAAA